MKNAPYILAVAAMASMTSCSTEKQAVAQTDKIFAEDFKRGFEQGISDNTKDHYNECFAEDFARGFNEGIKANSKDYYNECFAEDFARGLNQGLKAGDEQKNCK